MREQYVPTANLLDDVEAKAVDTRRSSFACQEPVVTHPLPFRRAATLPVATSHVEELGAMARYPPISSATARSPSPTRTTSVWSSRGIRTGPVDVRCRRGHVPGPYPVGRETRRGVASTSSSPPNSTRTTIPTSTSSACRRSAPQYLGSSRKALHSTTSESGGARTRARSSAARCRHPNEAARGGFVPPAMPGHTHDLAPAYDVERARSLLARRATRRARPPELRPIQRPWIRELSAGTSRRSGNPLARPRSSDPT